MPSPSDQFRSLVDRLILRARRIYRSAVSEQVLGGDPAPLWNEWRNPVSALMLAAEAMGQRRIVMGGRLTDEQVRSTTLGAMEHDLASEHFAEVADLFQTRIPMTSDGWKRAALAAWERADGMARHEASSAVVDMGHQSPRFAEMASGAFFATGLTADQAKGLRDVLAGVMRGETTVTKGGKIVRSLGLSDLIKRSDLALGLSLTDARYENIMRTNMASAQTESERRTLRNPTVRKFVPLLQWSAVNDSRTRPTHLAMHGYVNTVDEFDRQRLGPPASWQCRCSAIPVPVATAIENGWVDVGGVVNPEAIRRHNGSRQALIDSGQFPDPAFVV